MILFIQNSKPEIPLWLFIILVLVLGAFIGWLMSFFPSRGGNSRHDPFDDFDGDADFF